MIQIDLDKNGGKDAGRRFALEMIKSRPFLLVTAVDEENTTSCPTATMICDDHREIIAAMVFLMMKDETFRSIIIDTATFFLTKFTNKQ